MSKKVEAIPFITEDYLDSLESVKNFLQDFIDDSNLAEMKAAIDIAARAKCFREMRENK
jgi:DNA-binding phage protein